MITVNKSVKLPETFRIACKIHRYSHTEVLQSFIDHVSMYDLLAPPTAAPASLAGEVIDAYYGKMKPKFRDALDGKISADYLRKHVQIIWWSKLAEKEKKRKCRPLTNAWYKALNLPETKTTKLQLNEEITLSLSREFRLVCRVFHFDPARVLYYFMEGISLPRLKALSVVKKQISDPALGFFIRLADKLNKKYKDRHFPAADVYHKYLDKLQKLDRRQLIEADMKKREQAYTKLYTAWYKELSATRKTGTK